MHLWAETLSNETPTPDTQARGLTFLVVILELGIDGADEF